MDPITARATWRALEPVHAMIYFVPEARDAFAALGLKARPMGYFASRAAAMGPVPLGVVVATFYNFNPALVATAIPEAWSLASPEAILDARLTAVDRALRRGLGEDAVASHEVAEAAVLARAAAEAAVPLRHGRPLFAAHAGLPWPDEPHLVLWHAQTLLREFRGDGHLAALLLADLDPVEALVSHAASGDVSADALKALRRWSDDDWAAGVERLRRRGLVADDDELRPTEAGAALRRQVEDRTDAAAVAPYAALGDDGAARLRELGAPLSRALVDAGLYPARARA
jgi:hypothetical protein